MKKKILNTHPGIYNKINKQNLQNSEDLRNMIMYTYIIKMYGKKYFEHSKIDFFNFFDIFHSTTYNIELHSSQLAPWRNG